MYFYYTDCNPHAIDLLKSGKKSHDLANSFESKGHCNGVSFKARFVYSSAQIRLGLQVSSILTVGGVIY